jgi:hypothetical protein
VHKQPRTQRRNSEQCFFACTACGYELEEFEFLKRVVNLRMVCKRKDSKRGNHRAYLEITILAKLREEDFTHRIERTLRLQSSEVG